MCSLFSGFPRKRAVTALAVLLTLLALLLAAACQPMPRPFARDGNASNPLLDLPDAAGVLVAPVEGVSPAESRRLARKMAEALHRQNIPASVANANRRSYRLRGKLRTMSAGRGGGQRALVWDLYDRAGKRVGSKTQPLSTPSARNRAVSLDDYVALAAPQIGALITRARARPAEAPPGAVSVFVPPVAGATGDGPRALQNAMRIALRRTGMRVLDTAAKDGFAVKGTVKLGPVAAGRRRIAIRWSVHRSGGGEIGAVDQKNTVPAAAVEGTWGDMAHLIALNAADGVSDLLRRAGKRARGR